MAIISVIIMFIVMKLIYKGEKMQALITNLAMIRGVKAISKEIENINKEYWINNNMVIIDIIMHFIFDTRKII